MLNIRGLYEWNSPLPPRRTPAEDRPTLLVSWWCCACCSMIILYRVVGGYSRTMRGFADDKWMAASALPLVIRMGLIHAVLELGTNDVNPEGMEKDEVKRREIGSRLVLFARVIYITFIWSQKFCITEFYKRLSIRFWGYGYGQGLKIVRWILLVTFVMAVISIFAECRPMHKLWQVKPDPGPQCRESFLPLVFFGCLNVLTDLLIIFFPVPAIISSHMQTWTKLHLILLFSLSFLPVTTTLYRIPSIIANQGDYGQPYRSLWASLESLAACVCANAVILNGYARGRGAKRGKFRPPNREEGVVDRRSVKLGRVWSSNVDLAGDLGMGMDTELSLTERSARSLVTSETSPPSRSDPTPPLFNERGQCLDILVPTPTPAALRANREFDEESPQYTTVNAITNPVKSLITPERTHDRGKKVLTHGVGGLLEGNESPEGNRRSGRESTNGGKSYDNIEVKEPEEVMLSDLDHWGLSKTAIESHREA